jgi:hypothetical protein
MSQLHIPWSLNHCQRIRPKRLVTKSFLRNAKVDIFCDVPILFQCRSRPSGKLGISAGGSLPGVPPASRTACTATASAFIAQSSIWRRSCVREAARSRFRSSRLVCDVHDADRARSHFFLTFQENR